MTVRRSDISEVWTQAWPTIIAMLSYTAMQFVDSLMVSLLGAREVAAQGNGGMWSWVPISAAFGALALVNTLVAQRVGAKRSDEIARYGWAGLYLAAFFWLFVLLPYAACLEMLFGAMGHEPALVETETSYARILLLGGFVTVGAKALQHFFFGLQRPKVVTVAAIAGNIVNCVVSYALIFGEQGAPGWDLPVPAWLTLGFSLPALGLAGAAYGTVIGTAVEASVPATVFLSRGLHAEFGIRHAWRPDFRAMKEILVLGWPAGLQLANEMVCWAIFMTVLAGGFGTEHMTAGWCAMRFVHISFMPAVGLASAATSLVGKHIGEGQLDRARRSAHIAVGMAVLWMGLCAAIFIVFRHQLTSVFLESGTPPDAAARICAIGSSIFICAAIFQMLDGVGIVFIGALRGAGDTLFPGLATVILSWLVIVLGGYLMTQWRPDLASTGPWIASAVYIMILGVVVATRFERGGWRRLHLISTDKKPE